MQTVVGFKQTAWRVTGGRRMHILMGMAGFIGLMTAGADNRVMTGSIRQTGMGQWCLEQTQEQDQDEWYLQGHPENGSDCMPAAGTHAPILML